ncbi:MAG: hypothetical protein K9M84_09745 [Spirochaetia bacterium]|nr:hypothetical protein [Spirochaetia bacterium]MCF7941884.1 hypothetical protein [Spirochaetia bacterium]
MNYSRRLGISLLILIALSATVFADEVMVIDDAPALILSPTIEAMGGANTAIASGFDSLFTNPAGLSRKGGQLTFASVTVGPYFLPTDNMIDLGLGLIQGGDISEYTDDLSVLLEGLDLQNGTGANINAGLGFAAFGIGLGFLTDVDLNVTQEGSAVALFIEPVVTSSLTAGLSHGFSINGATLHLGADVRGIVRLRPVNPISITTVLELLDDSETSDFNPAAYPLGLSIGYGYDAGAILEFSSGYTIGAALKDIGGTQFVTANQTVAGLEDSFTAATDAYVLYDLLLADELTDYGYVIPMSLTAGVGYDSPEKELIDFRFAADYTHIFYSDPAAAARDSVFKNIHAGAEISLLRMIKLRGGINQGYFTAGVGLNLLVLEVNAAYYSREMGTYAGHKQNEAFAVGARIKL